MEAVNASRSNWRHYLLGPWAKRCYLLLFVAIVLWCSRFAIMGGVGHFLVREDDAVQADAIYVLGGSPVDRALEGVRLQRAGLAPRVVFTGSMPNDILLFYGMERSEAAIGADVARRDSFPNERIELLEIGTSTFEEAQAVRAHAQSRGYDTVMVVTTEFHTRRTGQVFRKALRGAGVTVIVRAASSSHYDADRWWDSEQGLLMVNNEYVKLLYYALHH